MTILLMVATIAPLTIAPIPAQANISPEEPQVQGTIAPPGLLDDDSETSASDAEEAPEPVAEASPVPEHPKLRAAYSWLAHHPKGRVVVSHRHPKVKVLYGRLLAPPSAESAPEDGAEDGVENIGELEPSLGEEAAAELASLEADMDESEVAENTSDVPTASPSPNHAKLRSFLIRLAHHPKGRIVLFHRYSKVKALYSHLLPTPSAEPAPDEEELGELPVEQVAVEAVVEEPTDSWEADESEIVENHWDSQQESPASEYSQLQAFLDRQAKGQAFLNKHPQLQAPGHPGLKALMYRRHPQLHALIYTYHRSQFFLHQHPQLQALVQPVAHPLEVAQPQVVSVQVDIDAVANHSQSTAVVTSLPAGTYTVHVIGTDWGGQYDAWSTSNENQGCQGDGTGCQKGFEHQFSIRTPKLYMVKRTGKYETPELALQNAPADKTIKVKEDGDVEFYVYNPGKFANNRGGVSAWVTGIAG
jgi:hypothetical protein